MGEDGSSRSLRSWAPWQATHEADLFSPFSTIARLWMLFSYILAPPGRAVSFVGQPEQSTGLRRAVWGTPWASWWQSVQERSLWTDPSYAAGSTKRLVPGRGGMLRRGLSGPPGRTFDSFSPPDHPRGSELPWQSRQSEFPRAHGEEGVKASNTAAAAKMPAMRIPPRNKGEMITSFLSS